MKLKIAFISALAATVLLANQAQAAPYRFTTLKTSEGVGSGADAINNFGQVAGYANVRDTDVGRYGTIWNKGIATTLGVLPGESYNAAQAINNHGVAVGSSTGDDTFRIYSSVRWNGTTASALSGSHALGINDRDQIVGASGFGQFSSATLWQGDSRTELGSLMGNYSYAKAINNKGQVVGASTYDYNFDAPIHAVLWSGGAKSDLGTLGGTQSAANDISASGVVVGWSEVSGSATRHAALWSGDRVSELGGFAGFSGSEANAINASGTVVGFASLGSELHAAMWRDGTVIDLNGFLSAEALASGWVLRTANDINDQGWIVGNAVNARLGLQSGYLLTAVSLSPVPEPQTWAMLLLGLGCLGRAGWLARRRRSILNHL